MNTPPEVAKALAPMLEGKTICDLGCGSGFFLRELSKYAKKAIGIQWEKDGVKGDNIVVGDLLEIEWPEADIYYSFTFSQSIVRIVNKHKKGVLILGGTVEKYEHFPDCVKDFILIDILFKPCWEHQEDIFTNEKLKHRREIAIWRLAIKLTKNT